jgi:hypothetical protein
VSGSITSSFIIATSGGKHDVLIRGGILEMCPGSIVSAAYGEGLEHDITYEQMTMRYCNSIVWTAWGDFTDPQAQLYPIDLVVRNCFIGWGGAYAMAASRLGDCTFEYNEIAYGNFGPSSRHGIDDEGMMKFGGIRDFSTFRYNWIHHNNASTWWDTKAGDLLFEESVIEDNPMAYGVMLEDIADQPAIVRRNYWKDNGHDHPWSRCSHGYGTYDYDVSSGHLRLNATNNLELAYNWFIDTLDATEVYQNHDVEMGWQSRSTGTGPKNTWIHHNRHERKLRLGSLWKYTLYKGFTTSNVPALHEGHRLVDNNKWDYNEYHCKAGYVGSTDWFNRGANITWTTWRNGAAAQWGDGAAQGPSCYDPHSTFVADL